MNIYIKRMGSGHSNGRHITPRYEAVRKQLDYTHDLNAMLKDNGYSPADGLYGANRKARNNGLIGNETYYKYDKANRNANRAKHQWD